MTQKNTKPTPKGWAPFINDHLLPACIRIEREVRHHQAIQGENAGRGLAAAAAAKLTRYETHLDRKFERTLAMLLKLKELGTGR